ncbi:MAG TPA: fused MFS/spermidine synthase [Planctomycetota bacterium]|nr:fused MFS/spermidine synthase [Planctomycetota bacterium]
MRRLATPWLLVTAASCGAVVMALELLGARLLSVAYGGSLDVWAAVIAVTLLSLAIGYFVGGWLSDRRPRPALLYGVLIVAGVLVVLCPYTRPILKACAGALGMRGGALASSAIVFSLPLALLGMASPFIIRLLCHEARGVGIRAGGVYALSTLGSVAGTLLTGLWLIPEFGTSTGFRLVAVLTAATGAIGLASTLGWRAAVTLAVPVVLAFLPCPESGVGRTYTAPDGERVEVVAVRDSAHGRIVILDKGDYRLLVVNGIVQTGIPRDLARLSKGECLRIGYYQELLPYTVADPRGRKALLVGLAGGMTAAMLELHDIEVDCVDIDPEIIEVAREHFRFTGHAVAADGRLFLEQCATRYDFCILDTYSGDAFPFHLATRQGFEAAKRALKPDGVLAINYIGAPNGQAFACVVATLKAVFPHVFALRKDDGDDVQTITVFASGREIQFNKGWLDSLGSAGGPDLISQAIQRLAVAPSRPDAFVLTDDYCPMDFLRADEALRWRALTARTIGKQGIF